MKDNLLRDKIIEASAISRGSRLSRLFRHPINTLTPFLMRKTGMRKEITVPTVWGGKFSGIIPESVSSEVWRSGTFELPVSLSLLHFLKPGGTYLDIGAHFGFFSLLASYLLGPNGRVLSIEAMPSTFAYLKANIEKNASHKNVTLFQGAAYSERTELQFHDYGVVASSLNSTFTARDSGGIIEDAGTVVAVQAHRADDVAADLGVPTFDLVKIDAESSEMFVLQGMSRLLQSVKPAIVMEVGDADPSGTSVKDLLAFMGQQHYSPFSWNEEHFLRPFIQESHVPYANLVFCHKDRQP